MSTTIVSNGDFFIRTNSPATITNQASSPNTSLSADRKYSTVSNSTGDTADDQEKAKETKKAREVAKKFESLLVHSLLKSMRKTTLAEDTSNERAMYDDMLDKSLADTIVSSGGLGIADSIFRQISKGHSNADIHSDKLLLTDQVQTDRQRLRDLAMPLSIEDRKTNAVTSRFLENAANHTTTDIGRLQMVSKLWSTQSDQSNRGELRRQEFIETLLPEARIGARKLGTTPSVVLAIAALETGWGRSMIKDGDGNNSHNLFGIKASAADTRYAITRTTEYIDGSPQKIDDKFKVFADDADAVEGFIDFLTVNPRYEKALEHAGEPERFLRELQKAGYATDPEYADKAISIMRQIEQKPLPL